MAKYFLYRVNGGQVFAESTSSFGSEDPYLSEVQDPVIDASAVGASNRKYVAGTIYAATEQDLAAFAVAEAADLKAQMIAADKLRLQAAEGNYLIPAMIQALAELMQVEEQDLVDAIEDKLDAMV